MKILTILIYHFIYIKYSIIIFSFNKAHELQVKIAEQMKKETIEWEQKRLFHREKEISRIKKIQQNEVYANKLKRTSVFGNFEKNRNIELNNLKQMFKNKKNELKKEQKTFVELQKNLNKTKIVMSVPGSTKIISNLLY